MRISDWSSDVGSSDLDNPLLAGAVSAARRKGLILVAAVGNDGPAAPPAFPASYDGVVAVTGVDGRNRALIEAGRALHLDYSAPGADMVAANINGEARSEEHTSDLQSLMRNSYAVFCL